MPACTKHGASDGIRNAAGALYELGMLAFQRGDTELARTRFEESRAIFDELNHRAQLAYVRLCLAIVALRERDFNVALADMRFSLEVSQADRDDHGVAEVLEALACLAVARGPVEPAMRIYGAASALRDKVGMKRSAFKQASLDAWLGDSPKHAGGLLAAGRAMPLDAAVQLALEIADVS